MSIWLDLPKRSVDQLHSARSATRNRNGFMTATLMIDIADEDETDALGRCLAEILPAGAVVALIGPLGAGKTRLVRSICSAAGVEDGVVASPTFVLVHEYEC